MGEVQRILSNYKRIRQVFNNPQNAVQDPGIDLWRGRSRGRTGVVLEYPLPRIKIRAEGRKIRLAEILIAVSEYYRIPTHEIRGKHREAPIVRARHAFIFLALKHTQKSLAEVGREIAKDHTTVIHACRKMGRLAHANEQIQRELNYIEGKFLGGNYD